MRTPPRKPPTWLPNAVLAAGLLLILAIANVMVWRAMLSGHGTFSYLWQMLKSLWS